MPVLVLDKELVRIICGNQFDNAAAELEQPSTMVKQRFVKTVNDVQIATMPHEAIKDERVGAFAHQVDKGIAKLFAWIWTKTASQLYDKFKSVQSG